MFGNDSLIGKILNDIGDIVILNIIFCFTSLPIVTLGASSNALLYAFLKKEVKRDRGILKDYFYGFKSNFKEASILWLALLACLFVVRINYSIFLLKVGKIFLGFYFSLIFLIFIYGNAVIAAFENKLVVNLKNAILMIIIHMPYSLIILLTFIFPLYFTIVDTRLFALYFFLWSFVGFGLLAKFYAFILMRIFRKYPPYNEGES